MSGSEWLVQPTPEVPPRYSPCFWIRSAARNVRLKAGSVGKAEVMKRLLSASIATCCFLLTAQSATAKGCLEGAALGGAVGHMRHHTFLGIFGGCAGGLYVHHLYAKWHREHPNGNLNQFADDYHGWLPAGWDERLRTAGDASPHPGSTKPTGHKSTSTTEYHSTGDGGYAGGGGPPYR
jgi:hypothetical protein